MPGIKLVEPKTRSDLKNKNGSAKGQTVDSKRTVQKTHQNSYIMDGPLEDNGQLRLGKDNVGNDSLSKDKLDKSNKEKNNLISDNKDSMICNGIMTEQQLLQAVYINQIKDKNANNIIECVSYLKYLPIEVIKIALERTSLKQPIPEWKYTRDILNSWIQKGIKSISEIEELNKTEEYAGDAENINIIEAGGFKRKGDEILNG